VFYICEVKQQSAQPTLTVRVKTSTQQLPQVFARVYASIGQYLGELGEKPAGPPFAAYYNMDAQAMDVEIGFPVAKQLPGRGEIKPGATPSGQVATCLHTGPYNEAPGAYEALSHFLRESKFEATGVAYELYLNDPAQTPPEELQTQVMFPLKPA